MFCNEKEFDEILRKSVRTTLTLLHRFSDIINKSIDQKITIEYFGKMFPMSTVPNVQKMFEIANYIIDKKIQIACDHRVTKQAGPSFSCSKRSF